MNKRFSITAMLSGPVEIDADWGVGQFAAYMTRIGQMASGATFDQVGFKEMREGTGIGYVCTDMQGGRMETTEAGKNHVAIARLSGVMMEDGGMCNRGVRELADSIRAADANPDVVGGVLEVNSGGGQSMAGTVLGNALRDVKKPWMVLGTMVGSAAYKAALPASKIYAAGPAAQFGSVGTMTVFSQKSLDWIAKNETEVYAKQATAKNEEWRALLRGDQGPLVDALTKHNEAFIQEVADNRPINPAYAGRVYSGAKMLAAEAMEAGLADGVRTLNEVIQEVAAEADRRKSIHSYNQSHKDMDIKNFVARLAPVLAAVGFTVNAEAKPEEVIAELEGQAATFRQTVVQEAVEAAKAAVLDLQKLQATQGGGEQAAETEAANRIAELEEKLRLASQELAQAKMANQDAGGGRANGHAPNMQQFQTGQKLAAAVAVGGEAKYS
jgi:ClpP class serine protease